MVLWKPPTLDCSLRHISGLVDNDIMFRVGWEMLAHMQVGSQTSDASTNDDDLHRTVLRAVDAL